MKGLPAPFRAAAGGALAPVVLALGLVSLLTDLSSEMIYPLLPAFLTEVLGAGAVALGAIEGVAEATAALVKVLAGRATDRTGRRTPYVVAGYSLSGLARPAIGLAATWPLVLACRFADRVGKGIRSAPRDALIADWTPPALRGRAYGLHRGMDHLGAVLGPLVAAGLLALGLGYRAVFLAAVVPGIGVVIAILLLVREPDAGAPGNSGPEPATSAGPPRRWPLLLGGAFLGAAAAPVDAFLLLLLTPALGAGPVALLWSLHNVVRFLSTFAAGVLADRFARLPLVVLGWTVRAAFLAAFGMLSAGATETPVLFVVLFVAYGAAAALTEPAERALVADLVRRTARGRAFGAYHAAVGLGALPAGLVIGGVWDARGPAWALLLAAGVLVAGAGLLAAGVTRNAR